MGNDDDDDDVTLFSDESPKYVFRPSSNATMCASLATASRFRLPSGPPMTLSIYSETSLRSSG